MNMETIQPYNVQNNVRPPTSINFDASVMVRLKPASPRRLTILRALTAPHTVNSDQQIYSTVWTSYTCNSYHFHVRCLHLSVLCCRTLYLAQCCLHGLRSGKKLTVTSRLLRVVLKLSVYTYQITAFSPYSPVFFFASLFLSKQPRKSAGILP
jgi:hypothetical protein